MSLGAASHRILVPAAKVEAIGDGGGFGSLLVETVREVAE